MNPAEALAELAATLEAGRPKPGSPEEIFVSGVRCWLDEGGALDAVLGLRGRAGVDTARTRYLRSLRDANLMAAHALCDGGTPWARSTTLSREIRRFLTIVWPRWIHLDAPPADCSTLRSHLFAAVKAAPPRVRLPPARDLLSDKTPVLIGHSPAYLNAALWLFWA